MRREIDRRLMNKSRYKILTFCMIILLIVLCVFTTGCGLKEAAPEQLDELEVMIHEEKEAGYSNVTKTEKSYEIAVVFDNSGSMYKNKAWSRAKYAMEIFASMLNYEVREEGLGDVLKIFPMWPVTTDGSTPAYKSGEGTTDPIVIQSVDDIDKIHNMYTVDALGTPYQPVKDAYEELSRSSADEKWLMVLTDGAFDDIKTSTLGRRLAKLADKEIKVQYLGVGDAADLDKYGTEFFFTSKTSSSDNLKEKIVSICNQMFQRDTLPSSALVSNKLTLDMSMRNIIVFAQGNDAKILKLVDSLGREIDISLDSNQRKYSMLSAANYPDAKTDTELAGQVVTFSDCPKGTYQLEYSDAESVQVFYEPDIDIKLTFSNENGQEIDMTGKKENLYPGEFTLNYSLYDSVTGEDVTNSPLLGNVLFEGGVQTSDGNFMPVENGGTILLEPDEATFLQVTGHYLDSYTITTDDRQNDYTVVVDYPPIETNIEVVQKRAWYNLRKHESWEPVLVHVSLENESLSDIQLEKTELDVKFDRDLEYHVERVYGESAFAVYPGIDDSGTFVKPETGKYIMQTSASYLDQDKEQISSKNMDRDSFKIKNYPLWLLWLLIILGILLLILLIYWWMMHSTFPESMYLKCGANTYPYDVRKQGMSLSSRMFASELTCQAKPKSPHMDRKSPRAKVEVSHISGPSVKEFTIGNKTYIKDSAGAFIGPNGKPLKPEDKFILRNNTLVEWKYGDRKRSGTIVFSRQGGKNKKAKKNVRKK